MAQNIPLAALAGVLVRIRSGTQGVAPQVHFTGSRPKQIFQVQAIISEGAVMVRRQLRFAGVDLFLKAAMSPG